MVFTNLCVPALSITSKSLKEGSPSTRRAQCICCCLAPGGMQERHNVSAVSSLLVENEKNPCLCDSSDGSYLDRYVNAVKVAADAAARQQLEQVVEVLVNDR